MGGKQAAAALPRAENENQRSGNHDRKPAAARDFQQIGGEKRQIKGQEDRRQSECSEFRPPPFFQHHDAEHKRGQHHGAGGGDAVGRSQVAGTAETQNHQHHRRQQHPIDGRNINLADFGVAGMVNLHARGETELHGLAGERISARDNRLAGNHGGCGGQHNQRNQRPLGHAQEKRIADGIGAAQEQRTLADVIECECGQNQRQPGRLNRPAAEVSHVGVERFRPGNRQHHRTEADEAAPTVVGGEIEAVIGIERAQNGWVLRNLIQPGGGQYGKPQQHYRAEQSADVLCAFTLDGKQQQQHRQRNRQHPMRQRRADNRQPLCGGEHGNGRGNDGVAEKQSGADQPRHRDQPGRFALQVLHGLLHQNHHAAFAFVVGMEDKNHIFQRHHQNQRPDNQRYKTEDARFAHPHMRGQKGFFQGVKRAGADVAVNDAERGQHHRRCRALGSVHENTVAKG